MVSASYPSSDLPYEGGVMATPIFCCGAECGIVGISSLGQHWFSSSATFSTVTKRSGNRSLEFTSGATANTQVFPTSTRWVGRVYISGSFAPLASTELVALSTVLGPHVYYNSSDQKIYARVGTTSGATGVSVLLGSGTWYRIDFDFNHWQAGWCGRVYGGDPEHGHADHLEIESVDVRRRRSSRGGDHL
jgi:hypothetical protein